MSTRTDAATAADRRRVQQAALRAGLWVAIASAAVVAAITAVTVAVLFATSRPEHGPLRDGPPGGGWDGPGDRVIDLDAVVPAAILVGLVGVIALGFIAWWASRRAAQPLADALEVQRAFVADASHELRTPLTTLDSRIQLAQHRSERGGDVQAVLADLRRDAAVMDAVLTELLLSAETAGAVSGDGSATADVAASAEAAIAVIAPRAAERGVRLGVSASPGLDAGADATALTRALIALLDNAVRYSPAGSTIRVEGRRAGRRVEVRVADEGSGIAAADPERLFDRFARAGDDPGAGSRRGFGLGLALVRDIATRFGGTVTIETTSSAGTTFLIDLPASGRRAETRRR